MEKIDFVITWVDGNDPAWREEFVKYKNLDAKCRGLGDQGTALDVSAVRYRSWDNLQYWFRSVERFAPWVNKIHFITWGHLPAWLDVSNPKLNIVNHSDFIPEKYLPTFCSRPIEFNIHHIEGLADKFVLFCDDMFIAGPVEPKHFFRKGLPCDQARLYPLGRFNNSHQHSVMSSVQFVNRHYSKSDIYSHLGKWFNFRYSLGDMLRTAGLLQWPFVVGFKDHHLALSYLKSSFEEIWEKEPALLDEVCSHKFRTIQDISHSAIRYSALMEGKFMPKSVRKDKSFRISDRAMPKIEKYIKSKKYRLFCFNDSDQIDDFESLKQRLSAAFQQTLPEKSSYEL